MAAEAAAAVFYSCSLSADVGFGQEQGKIKRKKVPKPRRSTFGYGFAGFWAVARGFLSCPSLSYRVATAWFPCLSPLHAVPCSCTTCTDFKITAPPGEPQLTHGDLSTPAARGLRPPGTPVVPWAPNTQLLFWGFCFQLKVSDVRPVLGCSWAR